jgi:hypothetical protein
MLVKIILLFLLAMVLVALIGRAFFPSALPRMMQKRPAPPRCDRGGRPLIGEKTCACGGRVK